MMRIFTTLNTQTVTLESVSRFGVPSTNKFTGFYITIEKDPIDGKPPTLLGDFEIAEESRHMAKISSKCDHLVAHSSSFAKSHILVSSGSS